MQEPVEQPGRQALLFLSERGDPLIGQEGKRRVQAENARQVERAGFKPVRHIVRLLLAVGDAARSAANQWLQPVGKCRREQQRAKSCRAEQALVRRDGQRGQVQGPKVDRHMPGGLRRVEQEWDAVCVQKLADLPDRQQRAAHVGGVCEYRQTRVRVQVGKEPVCAERAVRRTGDPVDGNADQPFKLPERAHDRVMLHGADEHAVAGAQQPFDDHVDARRLPGREYDVGRRGKAEPACQQLPAFQHMHSCAGGARVRRAVDVHGKTIEICGHGVSNPRRFCAGCCSMI